MMIDEDNAEIKQNQGKFKDQHQIILCVHIYLYAFTTQIF